MMHLMSPRDRVHKDLAHMSAQDLFDLYYPLYEKEQRERTHNKALGYVSMMETTGYWEQAINVLLSMI